MGERRGEKFAASMDRISGLPDDLLRRILSFLPTKHAVATSILSSRWINLWKLLPVLDFDYSLYLYQRNRVLSADGRERNSVLFSSFVDKVLSLNHCPEISKFHLRIRVFHEHFLSLVNAWIQSVVLRNVVEFDLQITSSLGNNLSGLLEIPPCPSLQILKISGDWHLAMPSSGCFPNLRIFYFKYFPKDTCQGIPLSLFPSLPKLEKVTLFLKLKSHLHIGFSYNISGNALKSVNLLIDGYAQPHQFNVVIDAPNLEYLQLKDSFLAEYSFKNLPPNCEVKLNVGSNVVDYLHQWQANTSDRLIKLLQGICKAKSLLISANTTRVLIAARNNSLPVFLNLTELRLVLYPGAWNLLLHWLESCPNLRFLALTKQEPIDDHYIQGEQNWSEPEDVPSCLLFHLEELEISRFSSVEEKKVLNYLLENAKVLKNICWNVSLS